MSDPLPDDASPESAPAAVLDDERRRMERQEAIDTYNARRTGLGLPPLEPEKIARFLALDEEIATRAAAIRRHDEQKREQQETAEHKARAHSAELLAARIEGLRKAAQEREQQETAEPAATPEPPQPPTPEVPAVGQVILFPQWGDERRAATSTVFRSALFPALNTKQPRRYYTELTRLCSVDGIEVFFMGEQFSQSDLDVYLELLQIAHETPFGIECCFSAYSLLKALGRAVGAEQYKQLHTELIRLCGGTVDMTDHKIRYFGHLVDGGIRDEVTSHYKIYINPRMAALFKAGLWASLDIRQRRDLKRNQTAKALHAYYSTHAAPGPHRYETLASIIGLKNTSNPRKVKADLVKAHEALKQVGFLADYEASLDTIAPKVNHTPGQARHIVRKIIKQPGRPRGKKLS